MIRKLMILVGFGLLVTGCFQETVHQVTPPNIVFFLIDDLGWQDAGYMGSTCAEGIYHLG